MHLSVIVLILVFLKGIVSGFSIHVFDQSRWAKIKFKEVLKTNEMTFISHVSLTLSPTAFFLFCQPAPAFLLFSQNFHDLSETFCCVNLY